MAFQQEDFTYHSLYSENSFLEDLVYHSVPRDIKKQIHEDLDRFSKMTTNSVLQWMWQAEKNQPQLVQYDHWGKRIDKIEMDPSWDRLHRLSASEGLVAIAYERKSGTYSRFHQFLKLMIFHPSSAFYTCPLAMTDGAARVMELNQSHPQCKKYFNHLVTRSPDTFWTAGQWMTEKAGGSDVSRSETEAEEKQGRYFLYGTKWFTSAVTAHLSMTLAQTQVENKKKLSLFTVKIRDEKDRLNKIKILRLKDKLGTRAMPTAELELCGTEAFLIGKPGEGIKNIATVLNISRLYNSACATGTMLRLHSLLTDYSKKRKAFGCPIADHPLHRLSLLRTRADIHASIHFVSQLALMTGRKETNSSTEEENKLLRLMTPIAKLWTAKKSIAVVSELIEGFGGTGYIEDSHLPRFLRDSQVFSIWEGTTNILSLDTLRALLKDDSFPIYSEFVSKKISSLGEGQNPLKDRLTASLKICKKHFTENKTRPKQFEYSARDFSMALGDLFSATLMLEFFQKTNKKRDLLMGEIFIKNTLLPDFEKSLIKD